MDNRLRDAIMVTDVNTGKSYIRHRKCVGECEVVTGREIYYPNSRSKHYTCDACGKGLPLNPPPPHRLGEQDWTRR